MDISRNDLYRIIIEEYLKEENITESKAALDLLRKMKGDPDYDPRTDPGAHTYDPDFEAGDETVADERPPADETYPMEKPLTPEEEDEDLTGVVDSGETYPLDPDETPARPRPEMNTDALAATIGELIHGKDPEEVSEIFELVFEKLPGVEIGAPEEEEPESLYVGGAEGRPEMYGLHRKRPPLEELMDLIREVLAERYAPSTEANEDV